MARTKLTLQDVARVASERNGGKGGRALQRIAKSKGLTLSYATVDRILAGKYESTPQRPTIEALAVLAEMPVEEVYAAAGLPLPMASLAEALPEGADHLTVYQRRVVLDVIRGFIRDNDRMAELEQERDARVPGRAALLELASSHNEASLEAMGLDELYDLAELLGRAVPSVDEADVLIRLAANAEQIIERREHAATGRSEVESSAQPDGITAGAGAGPADTSRGGPPSDANAQDLDDLAPDERPRQEDYDRAADDSGPSLLEADDARAAARGEESQDPGSDEPV